MKTFSCEWLESKISINENGVIDFSGETKTTKGIQNLFKLVPTEFWESLATYLQEIKKEKIAFAKDVAEKTIKEFKKSFQEFEEKQPEVKKECCSKKCEPKKEMEDQKYLSTNNREKKRMFAAGMSYAKGLK